MMMNLVSYAYFKRVIIFKNETSIEPLTLLTPRNTKKKPILSISRKIRRFVPKLNFNLMVYIFTRAIIKLNNVNHDRLNE